MIVRVSRSGMPCSATSRPATSVLQLSPTSSAGLSSAITTATRETSTTRNGLSRAIATSRWYQRVAVSADARAGSGSGVGHLGIQFGASAHDHARHRVLDTSMEPLLRWARSHLDFPPALGLDGVFMLYP